MSRRGHILPIIAGLHASVPTPPPSTGTAWQETVMRDRFGFPAMPAPTYATPYETRYVGASGSVDNDGHSRDYPTTLRGWYEWWRGTGFQPYARMALIGGTPIRMLLASTKTRDDVDASYIPTDLLVEKFDWEANDAIIDTDEQSIAEGNWATFDWSGIPRDYTVNGGKAHRRYPHGLTFPCSRITVCRVAGYDSPAGGVQFGGNGNLTTNIKVHGMEMGFSYSHGVGFDPLDPFGSAFHTGMDVQWYIGHHNYDDSNPDALGETADALSFAWTRGGTLKYAWAHANSDDGVEAHFGLQATFDTIVSTLNGYYYDRSTVTPDNWLDPGVIWAPGTHPAHFTGNGRGVKIDTDGLLINSLCHSNATLGASWNGGDGAVIDNCSIISNDGPGVALRGDGQTLRDTITALNTSSDLLDGSGLTQVNNALGASAGVFESVDLGDPRVGRAINTSRGWNPTA